MNLISMKYDMFYQVENKWKKCLIALVKSKVSGLKNKTITYDILDKIFQMIN